MSMLARLALLVSNLLVMAPAASQPSLRLVRTIPLEGVSGRLDHLAFDVRGKRLLVAAVESNQVVVIDLASGRIAARLTKPQGPQGVCVLPEFGRPAVASGGDGKLRIFAADLSLLGLMEGLDDADNVRYDAAQRRLWVGYGAGALLEVEPGMMDRKREIKLSGHPEAFELECQGPRIFVNVPAANQVAVIDRGTGKVAATWPLSEARENYPMALDEPKQRLFVACRKPARLLVLDTRTGKTVAQVDCPGDADDLFFDAAQGRLYVIGGEGFVGVVNRTDADHYRAAARMATRRGARTGLFVPDAARLYVAVPAAGEHPAEVREFACER